MKAIDYIKKFYSEAQNKQEYLRIMDKLDAMVEKINKIK